jgi:hypothetical protein
LQVSADVFKIQLANLDVARYVVICGSGLLPGFDFRLHLELVSAMATASSLPVGFLCR